MTTLHDRLADLAENAPVGAPAPGLWDRGRRVHRRQRVGTVAIVSVTLVALGILGTTGWMRSRPEPIPAAPTDGMLLPDRFYDPSSRLSGTDDEGPIGPVSAIIYAQRSSGWRSTVNGLAGVSATTGEYRFLDLPGWPEADDEQGSSTVALSADGRRVAYWHLGPQDDNQGDTPPVDGVAVYDTVTGEVQHYGIGSSYGIGQQGLAWVGDELWFGFFPYDDRKREGWHGGSTTAWTPGQDATRSWSLGHGPSLLVPPTETQDALIEASGRTVRAWTSEPRSRTEWHVDRGIEGEVWTSPDGGRMAAVVDPDGPAVTDTVARPIVTLVPVGGGKIRSTEVPGVETNEVVGWRDDDHVVTFDYDDETYRSVDVESGESQELVSMKGMDWSAALIAQDAWQAPTYVAPAPPNPLSPWLVWGGGAGSIVLGGLALVLWRRRVRA